VPLDPSRVQLPPLLALTEPESKPLDREDKAENSVDEDFYNTEDISELELEAPIPPAQEQYRVQDQQEQAQAKD